MSQKYVRDAVNEVRSKFPPMTKLRHRKTKEIYIIGHKSRMSNFWLMELNPPRKGVESAFTILELFEACD